jgi:hypothetical protein
MRYPQHKKLQEEYDMKFKQLMRCNRSPLSLEFRGVSYKFLLFRLAHQLKLDEEKILIQEDRHKEMIDELKISESGTCRREEAAATIAAELQLCEAL